jgi:acyl carrier protein
VVLEEAPELPAVSSGSPGDPWQLLVLSARTPTALDAAAARLAAHLREHPDEPLADLAWTLQTGRRAFEHRRAVAARSAAEAADLLETRKDASDEPAELSALRHRWQSGEVIDWAAVHGGARRRRVPLPTYPFEGEHYWIEPESGKERDGEGAAGMAGLGENEPDLETATLLAACRALPQEIPGLTCRAVDAGPGLRRERLAAEILAGSAPFVAWRAGRRWVQVWEPWTEPPSATAEPGEIVELTGEIGPRDLRPIAELDPAEVDRVLSGVRARLAALGETQTPLRILRSSLTGVLGGPGTLLSSAVSLLLGAWAERHAEDGWISVAWDPEIGEPESREALRRIQAGVTVPQIAVSPTDLPARLERWIGAKTAPAQTLHPRPDLPVAFTAPSSDLERAITAVWSEILGLDRVGIHDNFFDLGGDSFIAVQVINRLRRQLGREIPVTSLFEALTASSLARLSRSRTLWSSRAPEPSRSRSTPTTSHEFFISPPSATSHCPA